VGSEKVREHLPFLSQGLAQHLTRVGNPQIFERINALKIIDKYKRQPLLYVRLKTSYILS
jgi:hypothetical protein